MTTIANDTSISDELRRVSMGFGELINQIGQGISQTTARLTQTGAASISALATTTVKVIAAEETIYDDAGQIIRHQSFQQELPLITFVDPVIYQWSQVRIQGSFFAQELSTATRESYSHHQDQESYGQGGLFVILGGGHNRNNSSGGSGSTQTLSEFDVSVGTVRLNALLEPRYDVGVPKPTPVVVGPNIAILQGQMFEEKDGGVLVGRTMEVLLEYRRADGAAIAAKTLSVRCDGLAWRYASDIATQTDADGRVMIILRREFLDPEEDTAQKPFLIEARKGLVNTTISVKL